MSRETALYRAYKPANIPTRAWNEIITSWENGLSDREASFRASRDSGVYITEAELKELVATSPEISGLKDFLLSDIVSSAKLNIAGSIRDGNISTSKWYLERKAADEFSTKAAVAFEGAAVTVTMDEKMKELDEFMEQFDTKHGKDTIDE